MSEKIVTTVGYDSYMNDITEIPGEVIMALGLSEENELEWIIEGDEVRIRKIQPITYNEHTKNTEYIGYVEKKTNELSGKPLDWAVLIALGWQPEQPQNGKLSKDGKYCFAGSPKENNKFQYGVYISHSKDWNHSGYLLEEHDIGVNPVQFDWKGRCILWRAEDYDSKQQFEQTNLLVAAMRAFVFKKLGDKVAIPKELL